VTSDITEDAARQFAHRLETWPPTHSNGTWFVPHDVSYMVRFAPQKDAVQVTVHSHTNTEPTVRMQETVSGSAIQIADRAGELYWAVRDEDDWTVPDKDE
jgi:hypothetical protein